MSRTRAWKQTYGRSENSTIIMLRNAMDRTQYIVIVILSAFVIEHSFKEISIGKFNISSSMINLWLLVAMVIEFLPIVSSAINRKILCCN